MSGDTELLSRMSKCSDADFERRLSKAQGTLAKPCRDLAGGAEGEGKQKSGGERSGGEGKEGGQVGCVKEKQIRRLL